jgi:hypothetical protein
MRFPFCLIFLHKCLSISVRFPDICLTSSFLFARCLMRNHLRGDFVVFSSLSDVMS